MRDKTFTMDEIMAAFEAVKSSVNEVGGEGAADTDRFLIDDVALDVRSFLLGQRAWVKDMLEKMTAELEGAA